MYIWVCFQHDAGIRLVVTHTDWHIMKQFLKLFELLTNLASSLLQFDLDEQNEANQRHHHEEGQKDAHVKILCGLLWKKESNRNTCVSLKGLFHRIKTCI